MDRKLLIHSKKGYLFAEFNFNYEERNRVTGNYTQYGHYETDPGEYSTYPIITIDLWPEYKKYRSVDEIKAYDLGVVKDRLGREMGNMNDYIVSYEAEDHLSRYLIQNHREVVGVVNIRSNFLQNMKELEFISTLSVYHDEKIMSDSLEGNFDLIQRIYDERTRYCDVNRVADRNMPPYRG